ncbi:OPT/YSL family transporter [Clostridium aminobutyricum]|uniref:OPT/YSL family transporter n=1 Tax=Clostridium aminobutyricum TaxID=33953 RepID=A0A939D7A6_CLOAM|nr:OPT/YSL family transporter [Clostridium aminobutyricum]MBN7772425.1 OPT/YSL family transporter [Clostridium aminobutyricum]
MLKETTKVNYARSFREQLTIRGLLIGSIGTVILTMSSMFVALKLSSLPWPIMFVALVSMFALKACGKTNINEINVTHTAMSAGSMVAGGLAFTLPGIWMLNPHAEVKTLSLIVVTVSGVILGLIFTAMIRKYFVVTKELPYPMGQAAAEALIVGDAGGKKAILLFASMALSAIFTLLRDQFMKIPATFMNAKMISFGSYGGIWLSPMLISVGYIIGPVFIGVWFLGAIIGDFGILIGGQSFGLWDAAAAASVKASLGIGLMVGTGVGIIVKGILPKAKEIFAPMFSKDNIGDSIIRLRWAPIVMVVIAFLLTVITGMGIVASIVTIVGVWLATSMSSQCVGQSGINPMEIFGIIVLIAAKAVSSVGQTEAFFVAAVVAVACGLVGDVMNDFKAGYLLKTDPKAQWIAEAVGSVIGALVSVGVLLVIVNAYGANVFGTEVFPAAQASAVAAMVGGISNMPAFLIGLIVAVILYCVNFPVMTLGLGVYLPFYLSATAFIGGMLRWVIDKFAPEFEKKGTGSIIAAGLLGGEAIVGVILALIVAAKIMLG